MDDVVSGRPVPARPAGDLPGPTSGPTPVRAAAAHPDGPRPRRTLWEEGRHPAALVVVASVVAIAATTLLDVGLLSGPGLLLDLVFVVVSVVAALAVRPRDFFAVGVLPPLLMLGVVVVLGLTRPETLADPGYGTVQTVVSGLSHHSVALGVGYALCLAVLGVRDRFTRGLLGPARRRTGGAGGAGGGDRAPGSGREG